MLYDVIRSIGLCLFRGACCPNLGQQAALRPEGCSSWCLTLV